MLGSLLANELLGFMITMIADNVSLTEYFADKSKQVKLWLERQKTKERKEEVCKRRDKEGYFVMGETMRSVLYEYGM